MSPANRSAAPFSHPPEPCNSPEHNERSALRFRHRSGPTHVDHAGHQQPQHDCTFASAKHGGSYASRKTKSEPFKLPSTAKYNKLMEAKVPSAGIDPGHWVIENGIWLWTEGGVRAPMSEEDLSRQDSFLVLEKKSPEPSPLNTTDLDHLDAGEAIDELDKAFRPTLEKWSMDEHREASDSLVLASSSTTPPRHSTGHKDYDGDAQPPQPIRNRVGTVFLSPLAGSPIVGSDMCGLSPAQDEGENASL